MDDFLLINGILVFLEYAIIGSAQALDFPKYFAPMMPPLSIVLADFMGKQDFEVNRNIKPIGFAAIFVYIYIT